MVRSPTVREGQLVSEPLPDGRASDTFAKSSAAFAFKLSRFDHSVSAHVQLTNESARRLVDPLLHLGIDLAFHQDRLERSTTVHLRRHSLRSGFAYFGINGDGAPGALAAHS